MRATLNIILMSFLGLSVCYCSLFSKKSDDKNPEEIDVAQETGSEYQSYDSSGVYNDIQNEAGDGEEREVSSQDYSDDSYGATESSENGGEDDLFLSSGDESSEEPQANQAQAGTVDYASEPLPAVEEARPAPKRRASKFKDGMYRMGRNCNMRKRPTSKSAKAGKVKKGKKLWVEGHNSKWVKVYKKSGPVYLSKICL